SFSRFSFDTFVDIKSSFLSSHSRTFLFKLNRPFAQSLKPALFLLPKYIIIQSKNQSVYKPQAQKTAYGR
ncbi:MAG: hypothetical protein ACLSUT_01855, partial [Christensenellales bacterium]